MMNLNELREKILPILKKWGVKKASVFGSYVREEAGEDSDVDIIVEINDELSLLDFIEFKLEIEDVIGKKVDLLEFATIKPILKDRILKEQVALI